LLDEAADGFQQMLYTRSIPIPKNFKDESALTNLSGTKNPMAPPPLSAVHLQTLNPLSADQIYDDG
jgi:hypothetical protein